MARVNVVNVSAGVTDAELRRDLQQHEMQLGEQARQEAEFEALRFRSLCEREASESNAAARNAAEATVHRLELSLLTLQALRPFFLKKVEKQRERWREIGWRSLPPELQNFLTTTFGERIQLYFSGTGPDYINLLTETKAIQVRANQEAESSSSTSTSQGLTAEQALVLLKKAREG